MFGPLWGTMKSVCISILPGGLYESHSNRPAAARRCRVWAIAELALTLRKTRNVVDSLDKTVNDLNNTIAEAQPVVAKLDGAVDELTPALAQMEPLLKSSKTAVDALTSNLVEVEAVVRDISEVTGSMAEASNAVSSVTDSAAGAVQKLFNKVKAPAADADRKLAAAAAEAEQPTVRVLIGEDEAAAGRR